jgi:hypothetical protein
MKENKEKDKSIILGERWFDELINENVDVNEGFVDRFVAKSRNWGFQDKNDLRQFEVLADSLGQKIGFALKDIESTLESFTTDLGKLKSSVTGGTLADDPEIKKLTDQVAALMNDAKAGLGAVPTIIQRYKEGGGVMSPEEVGTDSGAGSDENMDERISNIEKAISTATDPRGDIRKKLSDSQKVMILNIEKAILSMKKSEKLSDSQIIKISEIEKYISKITGTELGPGEPGTEPGEPGTEPGEPGGPGEPSEEPGESGTASVPKETPLSLTKRQKDVEGLRSEKGAVEVPLNSYIQKKLGLSDKAAQQIVKNIGKGLKAKGVAIAESKLHETIIKIIEAFGPETLDPATLSGDPDRLKIYNAWKRQSKEDAKDTPEEESGEKQGKLKKHLKDLGLVGTAFAAYVDRQGGMKDEEFMQKFTTDKNAQRKIIQQVRKMLRRQLKRRGFEDNEIQRALAESVAKEKVLIERIAEFYKNTDFEQKGKWQKLAGIK